MKLTDESKLLLGILVATVAIVGLAVWAFTQPTKEISLPRETLIPENAHTKGNTEAAVYLVEFSDFQCPACGAFAPTVDALTDKYKDRLLMVYRHFPLPSHQYAPKAAYAAEAASLQGKFWEAEKILFANQSKFSDTFFSDEFVTLLASASPSGTFDPQRFLKDLTSGEVKKPVERDLSQAQLLNLPGTPAFFLNGVLLKNLLGPQDLVKAVEKALNQ